MNKTKKKIKKKKKYERNSQKNDELFKQLLTTRGKLVANVGLGRVTALGMNNKRNTHTTAITKKKKNQFVSSIAFWSRCSTQIGKPLTTIGLEFLITHTHTHTCIYINTHIHTYVKTLQCC